MLLLNGILELNRIKRKQVYLYLSFILVLGFAIRYLPFLHKLMLDDTYYQYMIVKSVLENGNLPEILPLSNYPVGKSLIQHTLLLPYVIAKSYQIVQPFGIKLTSYMIFIPAFFGALAAIPLYVLTEQLFNRRTALVSTLVYVILPASINRSFAGFVEKEGLFSLLLFVWLYLFVKSIKGPYAGKLNCVVPAILSGIVMGLSFLAWELAVYYTSIVALSVLIVTLIKPTRKLSISILWASLIGFITIHLIQPKLFPLQSFFFSYQFAPLAFVSLFSVVSITHKYLEPRVNRRIKPKFLISFFLGFLALTVILSPTIQKGLFELRKNIIDISSLLLEFSGNIGSASVIEARSITAAGYTLSENPFSWLVMFIPLGGYYYIKRLFNSGIRADFESVFFVIWIMTSLFLAFLQIRFFYLVAPAASILIGIAIIRGAESLSTKNGTDLPVTEELKRNSGGSSFSRLKSHFLILILIFSIVGTIGADISFARTLKDSQAERIEHWENAMGWVAQNTPSDAVIIAWWDYGYVIQGLGKRATITDPGGVLSKRQTDLAKIFISNEEDALNILYQYGPRSTPRYIIVSYEELLLANSINKRAQGNLYVYDHVIPKSGDSTKDKQAIKEYIDSNGIESHLLENIGNFNRLWFTGFIPLEDGDYARDPEMKNKLLPKLLPFNTGEGKGLKYFELVYKDESNFILIYEILWYPKQI